MKTKIATIVTVFLALLILPGLTIAKMWASPIEIFSIDSRGNDEYELRFVNTKGVEQRVPLVSNEHGIWKLGDDTFHFAESGSTSDFPIKDDDYILVQSSRVSEVLRYETYDFTDRTVTFEKSDGSLIDVPVGPTGVVCSHSRKLITSSS